MIFSNLLEMVALGATQNANSIFHFQSAGYDLGCHPDYGKTRNICNYIHLPVQSGSNRILKEMNRLHTREEYFELIDNIRQIIPDCAISQDMITGFPTETEEDHQDTLSLNGRG